MILVLLNALLILAGPFLVVAPLAVATAVQMSPPRRSYRRPALRLSFGGWAVA
jgi:hypothetical protein